MNSIDQLITFFPDYINESYKLGLFKPSSSHVLVLSVRPKLKFSQPIIFNSTYNYEVDFDKNQQSHNHEQKQINLANKIKKANKNQIPDLELKYIKVCNYYDILSNLDKEIDQCNLATDSKLTIETCVDKVTRIRSANKLESLNFDSIIKDNQELLKTICSLETEEKPIHRRGVTLLNQYINNEVNSRAINHTVRMDRASKVLMHSETQTQTMSMDSKLEEMIISNVNIQLESHKIHQKTKQQASSIYNMVVGSVMKELQEVARNWSRISDEVNPDTEAKVMGMLAGSLPPEAKLVLDQIVRPLIVKSSKASQALMMSSQKLTKSLNNIRNSVTTILFDLH